MSENNNDLDAFFRQKQKKKKRGGIQDVDALGKKLDKNVRRQEQHDKEEEDRAQRAKDQQHNDTAHEDSEWHSYAPPVDVDLTAVKLKDMDMAEQEDEIARREMEEENRDSFKTWNVPSEKGEGEEDGAEKGAEEEEPKDTGPKKYVPPSQRLARASQASAKAPSLGDQEAFPSLGAAQEIQKEQEQAKKRQEHIKLLETTAGGTGHKEKENDGFQPYRPPRAWVMAPQSREPRQEPTTTTTSPSPSAFTPKPGSYVPPHLRKQQGGNIYASLQQE